MPDTGQLTATPKNAAGTALTGKTITYSSANTAVCTVDSTGLVRAVAVGTTTVKATVDGVDSNVCTVTVAVAGGVFSLDITPATATLVA